MNSQLKHFLLRLGWKLPYLSFLSPRKTVILEYHGIPTQGDGTDIDSTEFERHIIFLKRHFEIVPPDKLSEKRKANDKIRVMLTFDDGFRNHAEVVAPVLRKHHVPAMFFVSSRHSVPGRYLWFSYLCALEKHFRGNGFYFRREFINMSPGQRQINIRRLQEFLLDLTPHPAAMYQAIDNELPRLEDFLTKDELANYYAGMTADQVATLAGDSLFSIGVHTVDHPFLTRCEPEEACRQILENKTWIEQASQKKCDTIAYPAGDYDIDILEQSRQLNFAHGYVETPVVAAIPQLEIPRIGIYSPSLDILGFKVQWGSLMRTCRLNVG